MMDVPCAGAAHGIPAEIKDDRLEFFKGGKLKHSEAPQILPCDCSLTCDCSLNLIDFCTAARRIH